MQENPVVDLARRMAVSPESRHVLAVMKAGTEIEPYLSDLMPQLSHIEQRCLVAVVGFRLMGSMLPTELNMLERLPPTRGLPTGEMQDTFQALVNRGVLHVTAPDTEGRFSFFWPALEQLVSEALRHYEAPAIVGLDGSRLHR